MRKKKEADVSAVDEVHRMRGTAKGRQMHRMKTTMERRNCDAAKQRMDRIVDELRMVDVVAAVSSE